MDNAYIEPIDLAIGDVFCEDTYPEVWKVVSIEPVNGYSSAVARCIGYIDPRGNTGRLDEISYWYGQVCLYRLTKRCKIYTPNRPRPAIPTFSKHRNG